MKRKLSILLFAAMAAMMCVSVPSCGGDSKDEPTNPQVTDKDPDGTTVMNMVAGSDDYFSHPGGYGGHVNLNSSMNLQTSYGCQIVSVGSVSGLSKIKSFPTDSWRNEVAATPGTGYVVRFPDNYWNTNPNYGYLRIYVVDYLPSGNGVVVKYAPLNP